MFDENAPHSAFSKGGGVLAEIGTNRKCLL